MTEEEKLERKRQQGRDAYHRNKHKNAEMAKAKARARYATPEGKAKRSEYARQYYKDNQPRFRELDKEWKASNKEQAAAINRRAQLKGKYGLTVEQFEEMWEAQSGACAICTKALEMGSSKHAVDHCHTRGKVRGLLCGNCNTGLGKFFDNPEALEAAARYIRSHNQ